MDEKNYMKIVYLIGFGEEERKLICRLFREQNGIECREMSGDQINDLLGQKQPQMTLIKSGFNGNLKIFQQFDNSSVKHVIGYGIPIADRDLLFSINSIAKIPVFFIPIDENEFNTFIKLLLNAYKTRTSQAAVTTGMISSKLVYEWETAEIDISVTSKYLAHIIKKSYNLGPARYNTLQLGIEEALINSIEHGNLELDSSLKPRDIHEEDVYEKLKGERYGNAKYGRRRIRVKLLLDANVSTIHIEDEGPGFDPSKVNAGSIDEHEMILDSAGKGIKIIKQAFDEVKYNKKGKEIILIKRYAGE
ncbi:MAG: ATP-binding protein [Spirochaetales bacterium]|nr:ATP-binding protein [Spirochaetales bacterium]